MAGALENKERVKNYISSTGFPKIIKINLMDRASTWLAIKNISYHVIRIILTKNETFLRRVQILMAFPYDYRGPDSG